MYLLSIRAAKQNCQAEREDGLSALLVCFCWRDFAVGFGSLQGWELSTLLLIEMFCKSPQLRSFVLQSLSLGPFRVWGPVAGIGHGSGS